MATNSYQGTNRSVGANTFGGANRFAVAPDSRNIQASQIQDEGLRALLQDQFKPLNSYSKTTFAPLGQVKSLADQYQTIDQSKLDEQTKSFLQPYMTGKASSLDPLQAFIRKDQLTAAQNAMQAHNAAQQAAYNQQQQQGGQGQQGAAVNPNQALIDELYSGVTSSTADWQSRYAPAKESIEKYVGYGFVPGQDRGDWYWNAGDPGIGNTMMGVRPEIDEATGLRTWNNGYVPEMSANDKFLAGYQDDGWGSIIQNQNRDPNGYKIVEQADGTKTAIYNSGKTVKDWDKNSGKHTGGFWLNKDKNNPMGITFNPLLGYGYSAFDSPKKGLGKIMPALTMAALGAITGGAASAAMGAGSGALGGAATGVASAFPSALSTGLNTGDWGKAATSLGLGALGGGLSTFAPQLGSALGLEGSLGKAVGQGLISGGVNAAGAGLQGASLSDALKRGLSSGISGAGAGYLGNLATEAMGGGNLAKVLSRIGVGAGVGGLNALLNNQGFVQGLSQGALGGGIGALAGVGGDFARNQGYGGTYNMAMNFANPIIQQLMRKQRRR